MIVIFDNTAKWFQNIRPCELTNQARLANSATMDCFGLVMNLFDNLMYQYIQFLICLK